MNEIFKQLRFDEQSIRRVLAEIESQHDADVAQPDYMDGVRQYRAEITALQDAAKALDAAIKGLSLPTRIAAQDALPHFAAGIHAMPEDMPVNVLTPPGQAKPSQKTQVKNRFVLNVAQAYRKQTGKRATISIDAVSDNSKGGLFAAFLLACADKLGIDTKGLVRRAQALREKGEI